VQLAEGQRNYGDKVKEDETGEICSTHGEMRNAFKILIAKQ